MKKTIAFLLLLLVFDKAMTQQTGTGKGLQVNFKLSITEMKNPDSVGIYWFVLPYQENTEQLSLFPKESRDKAVYQQTILFPDSLLGKTISYLYAANQDRYDFMRNFVLNGSMDRIETWGYADDAGKIKPTQMLFTEPGSPAETAEFAAPYIGITTNGTAIKNLFPLKKTGYTTLPVKNAVIAFLASLTEEEKAKSTFPIGSNEWRRWHNIERWERSGVCLEQMTAAQKNLVFAFLKESLSARGLQKAKDIMTMEDYLASLVPESKLLGGEKYWFTFFGTPSDEAPWGWQIEGHHLVINYFVLGDQVVMTPTFMGSEPTYIDSGEHKGLRTFRAEEEKGLQFYLSLTSVQKKEATLYTKKEYDFNRSEAFRDNEIIATTGIAAKKLSVQQREALLDLIAEYVNNIRDGQAKVKMADVKQHLNETHFTWVQNNNPESPFYYRIHSPVILIEFDHQTPVFLYDKKQTKARAPVKSHIHTVVRTPNGNDYGKDLLREHLEKDHKGETHHHHHKKPVDAKQKATVKKKPATKKTN
jgi:hypothetical protein